MTKLFFYFLFVYFLLFKGNEAIMIYPAGFVKIMMVSDLVKIDAANLLCYSSASEIGL